MERSILESSGEIFDNEVDIAVDPETSEILKKFSIKSNFGVECWQGLRSFNLIVPKNIFKKIGPGDPRLKIFSKTFGAKEYGDLYVIKLSIDSTNETIQEMVDSIETTYEKTLDKNSL